MHRGSFYAHTRIRRRMFQLKSSLRAFENFYICHLSFLFDISLSASKQFLFSPLFHFYLSLIFSLSLSVPLSFYLPPPIHTCIYKSSNTSTLCRIVLMSQNPRTLAGGRSPMLGARTFSWKENDTFLFKTKASIVCLK